ncbi:MAG TPA: cupin domain-containing protein [Povalibacter sp.]
MPDALWVDAQLVNPIHNAEGAMMFHRRLTRPLQGVSIALVTGMLIAPVIAAAVDSHAAAVMREAVIGWDEVPAKQADVRILRQFLQGPTATLEELEVHATTLAPGLASHPPHRHPNEELVIVKEGTVEAYIRGEWKRVGPGAVIFNASNELHAVRNVGEGPATYHVINWR